LNYRSSVSTWTNIGDVHFQFVAQRDGALLLNVFNFEFSASNSSVNHAETSPFLCDNGDEGLSLPQLIPCFNAPSSEKKISQKTPK
jgi:hypothetical protein